MPPIFATPSVPEERPLPEKILDVYEPQLGDIYQHFKGFVVSVVGTFWDTEDVTKKRVSYLESGSGWSRPLEMWHELVKWPDGTMQPRFKLLTPRSS